MTITCSWCGLKLGEKCPTCGERIVEPNASVLVCSNAHAFLPGEGGTTDTICEQCREEHFGAQRKVLAVSTV